jgi:hypothetical protein
MISLLMRPDEIAETFETRYYTWMYWIFLYFCLFLVVYLITHVVVLWLEFRTFLRAMERVRFQRGFCDLKNLTWKPLWKLAGNGRQEFLKLLDGEVEALTEVQKRISQDSSLAEAIRDAKDSANETSLAYERFLDGAVESLPNVRERFHEMQEKLATCASRALIYANDQWKIEGYAAPELGQDQSEDQNKKGGKDKVAPAEPPAKNPTTRALERFLCLFYVNIILVPLRRLQTLILAIAGMFVFVLLSYSSYPFESRESFHALLIIIFFAISLIVGIVYGQMYANPVLSRITNTTPGDLGTDFWVRIGTFVFVPLLSLLSVHRSSKSKRKWYRAGLSGEVFCSVGTAEGIWEVPRTAACRRMTNFLKLQKSKREPSNWYAMGLPKMPSTPEMKGPPFS